MTDIESVCLGRDVASCMSLHNLHAVQILNWLTAAQVFVASVSVVLLFRTVLLGIKATQAATRAADIASNTAEHSRSIAEHDLRPYMLFDGLVTDWLHSRDDANGFFGHRIQVWWKNAGRSIAHKEHGSVSSKLVPTGGFPKKFSFPDTNPPGDPVPIFPGSRSYFWVDVTTEQLLEVYNGKSELHIWSWVNYDGMNNNPYRTEVHFTVTPKNDPREKLATFTYSLLGLFNGADRECSRPRS